MPASIVKAWEGYIQEMDKDPAIISQLKRTGAWARYVGSDELRKLVQNTGAQMKELWQ